MTACGLLVTLAGVVAFRVPLLQGIGQFLNVGAPLEEPVDAVFILGGDVLTRPFVAAAIVEEGFADTILVPTPRNPSGARRSNEPEEEVLIRRVLEALDVPPQAIVEIPHVVKTTQGEAHVLFRFLDETTSPDLAEVSRIAIVTNDYHTRRTRLLFRRAVGDRDLELEFVSVPLDRFAPNNWWRSPDGLATYSLEYLKYLATVARIY